jgi:hypothetical protein
VHRAARSPSGRLFQAAVDEAADGAAQLVLGGTLPFDAWQKLIPERGAPVVVAHPRVGPVAEAVVGRLGLLLESGSEVEVQETAEDAQVTESPVAAVVWRPRWRDGALEPPPPEEVEGRVVLVDLFETGVDGRAWRADAIVAAPSVSEAAVVARHMLESRARGRIVDAGRLAAQAGLILEDEGWIRVAMAD